MERNNIEKKINKITYNCEYELKTDKPDLTKDDLIKIFNQKYYNYIKRKENRLFIGCNFD